jgi:hypothetical protein
MAKSLLGVFLLDNMVGEWASAGALHFGTAPARHEISIKCEPKVIVLMMRGILKWMIRTATLTR